jgi:hypothetical protein
MDAENARAAMPPARSGFFRHSAAHFLVALVAFLVSGPFIERWKNGAAVETALLTIVLALGVLAVGGRRRTLACAIGLAVPAITARWLYHLFPESVPAAVYLSLALVLVAFVVAQLLRFVLTARQVDAEVLYVGVANYLLLGIFWLFAYLLVDRLDSDAFAIDGVNRAMGGFDAMYFSFVTLTTVGFGYIAPVSGPARMLAMTEAMAGTLYVAILISRLVAVYSGGRKSE